MENVILVPLDGSPASESAVAVAIAIAHTVGGTVELAHVHGIPRFLSGTAPQDPALDLDEAEHMREPIAALAQRATEEHGVRVTARLLLGPAASMLARHAAERTVRLIVMTTHGRGGLSRAWLGSVADRLVRQGTAPVLLVRPGGGPTAPDWPPARVLVPLDGSPLAEEVLAPLAGLIDASDGVDLVLLYVVEPLPPLDPFPDVAVLVDRAGTSGAQDTANAHSAEAAQAYLDGVAARLLRQSIRAQTHVALRESPARAILEYADESQADLIALATHGRGGLERVLLGSVADKVIRGTTASVLVVRPTPSPAAVPAEPNRESRVPTHGS